MKRYVLIFIPCVVWGCCSAKAQSYRIDLDSISEGKRIELQGGTIVVTDEPQQVTQWVMEAIEANEVVQEFQTKEGSKELTYIEVKFRVTPKAQYVQSASVPEFSRIYLQRMERRVFDEMMRTQKAKGNEAVQFITDTEDRHRQFMACPLESESK